MAKKIGSMIRGRHTQHTRKFNIELNSITTKYTDAFRFSDEVWIIGKYKGTSLNNTPKEYIKWAAGNMKLSPTAISILENKL
jgi:hypothetical protein